MRPGYCLLTYAANTQVHLRLDFILEANNMNPDQTAPLVLLSLIRSEQSDLGQYCLQHMLPMNRSRQNRR